MQEAYRFLFDHLAFVVSHRQGMYICLVRLQDGSISKIIADRRAYLAALSGGSLSVQSLHRPFKQCTEILQGPFYLRNYWMNAIVTRKDGSE